MWSRTWVFRWHFSVNPFPHVSHLCGLSPVWSRTWVFRWHFRVNPFPHVSHLYGLSPVWSRTWVFRWHFSVNPFPHVSHSYGLSPLCARRCCSRVLPSRNNVLHLWLPCSLCKTWRCSSRFGGLAQCSSLLRRSPPFVSCWWSTFFETENVSIPSIYLYSAERMGKSVNAHPNEGFDFKANTTLEYIHYNNSINIGNW